jgi:hypothetical protein
MTNSSVGLTAGMAGKKIAGHCHSIFKTAAGMRLKPMKATMFTFSHHITLTA